MKLLKEKEAISLAFYLKKRIKETEYSIQKSSISNNRSIYLKNDYAKFKNIRISDHLLHPNQKRLNQIEIIIMSDMSVVIDGVPILGSKRVKYKAVIADYIINLKKLIQ